MSAGRCIESATEEVARLIELKDNQREIKRWRRVAAE